MFLQVPVELIGQAQRRIGQRVRAGGVHQPVQPAVAGGEGRDGRHVVRCVERQHVRAAVRQMLRAGTAQPRLRPGDGIGR
jgi:hypothetical protein